MKLSIITVNLNNAAGLEKTLASARDQVFRDFEHIVIDGGSTDGSRELIVSHSGQLAYWVSEADEGIYSAMTKGLKVARGERVYFLNSGDWLASPNVLVRIFTADAWNEDLLYGDSLRSDGQGEWKVLVQPDEITVARFFGMGICHQTLFYRKELFDQLGGYDERYRIIADWEFTLRALLSGRSVRHLPFPVVCYEGRGISATQGEQMEKEKENMRKRLIPDVVLSDYLRLQHLEKECNRLKQYEDWVEQIQRRNPFLNYAMATKWALKKLTSRRRRREGGRE